MARVSVSEARHSRSSVGWERLHDGIADTLISVADAFPWPNDFLAQGEKPPDRYQGVMGFRPTAGASSDSDQWTSFTGANYWGLTWRRKLSQYHLPVPTSIRHATSVRSSIAKTKNIVFCCHSLRMASTAAIRRSMSSAPSRRDRHIGHLAAAGIDTAEARRSGQLELRVNTHTYLRDGRFDQDRMLRMFERFAGGSAGGPYPSAGSSVRWNGPAGIRLHSRSDRV